MLKALGLIEVIGFVGAVEAADVALKAANVTLIGIEKVSAGIVTVKITGDVGAVKAAVEASEESARRLGVLRTSHVIARLHEETQRILQDPKPKEDKEEITETVVLEETEDINITEETPEIIEEEIVEEVVEKVVEKVVEEVVEQTSSNESERTLEELNSMKVEELRRLARNLKIPTMTNKQIKFAKKDVLIEELVKFYKESDD